MTNKICDAAFEAILRQAAVDNYNEELASMPAHSELEAMYTFSEPHEVMMEALFRREARRERVKTATRFSKRFAACIVLAISVLFGLLMISPNVRATVGDTLVEFFDQFVSIRYRGEQDPDMSIEWEPEYVPDGFTLLEKESLSAIHTLTYRHTNGVVMTLDYSLHRGDVIYTDNEHSAYRPIVHEGIEYRLFEAESDDFFTKVIWEQAGYYFVLLSKYDAEELLSTAFSVSKK